VKIIFAFMVFIALAAVFFVPLQTPSTPAAVQMAARWDDGTAVKGKVAPAAAHASGGDAVVASQPITDGTAQLTTSLARNAVYHVIVLDDSGAELAKLPPTTPAVKPHSVQRRRNRSSPEQGRQV